MPPGFWGGGMGPGVKPQPPFPPSGNVPSHPIEEPPKVPPPEGYEWQQVYSAPTEGGWTWSLVPTEGEKSS